MSGVAQRGFVPRVRRAVISIAVLIAVVAGFLVPVAGQQSAEAAVVGDWDAGYIIDDAVFYDSNAMSATDVQAFLNSKVTNCNAGFTCLKSYGQATAAIAADRYCNGYSGAAYESAAQIIDNVARSCGLSQRALLVLLEKEQGLVTSRAPSNRAFTAATGMACPDTAACDPTFAGFFYQVYYAARQFELYRMNPGNYGHRAGQLNNVRYSPNAACGTKSVFIYNQATAGLYNYTPYTPNEAALGNLYGAAPAGEQCSTYGNRNFWRLFTDWFGNPRFYVVHSGFQSYWNAQGGAAGQLGAPISYAVYVEQNGEGWYQRFQGGNLYGSFRGGTNFVANNVILAEYNRQGGPYGSMGFPSGEQTCAAGLRCAQTFVGAIMSTTPEWGAHVMWGGFRDFWTTSGGVTGTLGSAVNDMTYSVTSAGAAWQQNYQAGVVVQSNAGVRLIPYGGVLSTWLSQGGGAGWLGWPTSDYTCGVSGCAQQFSGGVLTFNPTWGTRVIIGGFFGEWLSRGGVTGSLGAALAPLVYSSSPTPGWAQNFAGGILTQSQAGMYAVPYGNVQALWSASGEYRGAFGWPISEITCATVGCVQEFEGGILSGSSWGSFTTFGGIAVEWKKYGAASLGPAISALRYSTASGGGWAQHFAGGIITQSAATGSRAFTPYGRILDVWYYYGAENTWLGWPTSDQACDAGTCVQQFQNGTAQSDGLGNVTFTPR